MGPELRQLRYFIAVAEELSFTRAAQRLGISQPSLSSQIQEIERLLGQELVARTTHEVRLTAAGSALLVYFRRVVAAHDELLAAARQTRGEQRR